MLRSCSLSARRVRRPLLRVAGRGLPGGNSLFFCFAKRKVSKRKGDPGVCDPSLRYGQPVVLGPDGVKNNSPAAQTRFCPDPSGPALLGAYTRGPEYRNTKQPKTKNEYLKPQGHAAACPCFVLEFGICFCFLSSCIRTSPCGWAEQRRRRRIRAKTCLSRRRVVFDPAVVEQRRLPAAKRRDPDFGSPFLLLTLLLAKQKKSELPPGNPRPANLSKPHPVKTSQKR